MKSLVSLKSPLFEDPRGSGIDKSHVTLSIPLFSFVQGIFFQVQHPQNAAPPVDVSILESYETRNDMLINL